MLKKIMVTDDSSSIREYLVQLLAASTDAEITGCADGQEAIELIESGYVPDLALFDLNMPRLDGVQLLSRLAEHKFTSPIIIISGLSRQIINAIEKLSKEYELNVIGSIGKPIDEKSIAGMLERVRETDTPRKVANTIKTYEILNALENGEVEAWYQPQVELVRRRLVGFEVLCRIRHKRHGLMLPGTFMDTLERSELIRVVTLDLIKKALADIRSLPADYSDLSLSFNLSARLFDLDEFIDELIAVINASPIRNDRVILEITETTVANTPLKELEGASRLAIAGCGLAIDDFGSGKATLERLHALPFTEMKIDQQYLPARNITEGERALLESTISMARRLGMKVVIEGVESFQQWELVQHLGCEMAQGYFISPPMPYSEVEQWIHQWSKLT